MRIFTLVSTCVLGFALSPGLRGQARQTPRCPDVELQKLEVIFMRLEPGSESLSVGDEVWGRYQLESGEVEKLRATGLKGLLQYNSGGSFGELVGCKAEKQARAIIVGQRPIKRPVELAQPDGVNVIYYQIGNEWKMLPSDAPVLSRKILLRPFKNRSTRFWVEHPLGSRQGGTAFNW